jgi:hypothetical protein
MSSLAFFDERARALDAGETVTDEVHIVEVEPHVYFLGTNFNHPPHPRVRQYAPAEAVKMSYDRATAQAERLREAGYSRARVLRMVLSYRVEVVE